MHLILPWVLASLSVALLLGAGTVALIRRNRRRPRTLPTAWALSSRPVFSADERRVYRQLREALPQHVVLSKLPLVRFCQPTDPQEVRYWYGLLGGIHVGFAICSASGRVLAAIDLDNESAGTQPTLQIKQSVLAACRVRYLRCAADHLPSIPELQLLVPQTGAAARGPHPAPTAATPRDDRKGARRRAGAMPWQDSGLLQDSSFGIDGPGSPGATGGVAARRGGPGLRESAATPHDVGGVVIDAPPSSVRH